MGVMIGMAAVGLAGGIMGSMGKQAQQQQQYHMQRMEAEKQNYLSQRKTDDFNWAQARKAALTSINNQKITDAATQGYADMKRYNRRNYQSMAHQTAQSFVSQRNAIRTEATGKNLRGGMADRMMAVASEQAKVTRQNNLKQYASADEAAANQYKAMLNKRDTLTRYEANMFVPSSMPAAPQTGLTLEMLGSALGGTASGAAQGAGMMNNLGMTPFWSD